MGVSGDGFVEDEEAEEEGRERGGRRPTRRAAWMRTERGSARDACSNEQLSGSLQYHPPF